MTPIRPADPYIKFATCDDGEKHAVLRVCPFCEMPFAKPVRASVHWRVCDVVGDDEPLDAEVTHAHAEV